MEPSWAILGAPTPRESPRPGPGDGGRGKGKPLPEGEEGGWKEEGRKTSLDRLRSEGWRDLCLPPGSALRCARIDGALARRVAMWIKRDAIRSTACFSA